MKLELLQLSLFVSWKRYVSVALGGVGLALLIIFHWGLTADALIYFICYLYLFCLGYLDYHYYCLPNYLTGSLLVFGLSLNISYAYFVPALDACLAALGGYVVLWLLYWIHWRLTAREGLGYGDFKFCAALGALLGWQHLMQIIFLASIIALLLSLVRMALRQHVTATSQLPLGTFLAIATAIILMFES